MESTEITKLCDSLLTDYGFECYPFQIGAYNSAISNARYRLDFDDRSLAVLVISVPQMFETTFVPWLRERKEKFDDILDPIDECMRDIFEEFRKKIDQQQIKMEILHDYEMMQGRYPRVLMNTAGHVAGAACYYQRSELDGEFGDKKLFNVSLHPKYGGWFAFRAVLIFPDVIHPNSAADQFENRIRSKEEIYELLRSFTTDWKTNEWRDFGGSNDHREKYSPMQKEYFSHIPKERKQLLKDWMNRGLI